MALSQCCDALACHKQTRGCGEALRPIVELPYSLPWHVTFKHTFISKSRCHLRSLCAIPVSSSRPFCSDGDTKEEGFSYDAYNVGNKTGPLFEEEERKNIQDGLPEIDSPNSAHHLQLNHPWNEWASFLNMLYKNNYFDGLQKSELERDFATRGSSRILKHAILKFGRERDDIFRCLTKKHIKAVVSVGCPNTDRKIVNASKRLRTFCGLSEDEVCQQCVLNSSCTRAFVAPDEQFEADTSDVARVLQLFASNAFSAESDVSHPITFTESACCLLSELVKFGDQLKDPTSTSGRMSRQTVRVCAVTIEAENATTPKRAGWTCLKCSYINLQRNRKCRRCSAKQFVMDGLDERDEVIMQGD